MGTNISKQSSSESEATSNILKQFDCEKPNLLFM